jgi:acyl-coenzyme A thioesterase PaaI-like protein
LKPVPPYETMTVECKTVREQSGGLIVVVEGFVRDASGATLLAKATAEMVDLSKM